MVRWLHSLIVALVLSQGCSTPSSQSRQETRWYLAPYDGDYAFTLTPLAEVLEAESLTVTKVYNGLKLTVNESTELLFEISSKQNQKTVRLRIKVDPALDPKTRERYFTAAKRLADNLWAKVIPLAKAEEAAASH